MTAARKHSDPAGEARPAGETRHQGEARHRVETRSQDALPESEGHPAEDDTVAAGDGTIMQGDDVSSSGENPPVDEEDTHRLHGDPMSWRTAAASWVGLVRRNNQDSAVSSPRVAAVADGMGGEAAGDLASMVAARQLWLAGNDPHAHSLTTAVDSASDDIADLVVDDPYLEGMGTTICGAIFDGHTLEFVQIGDSRAYRWRDGVLTQLTQDHSFVQRLIDQGHLTPEEARVHPKRSLVLRVVNGTALGAPDEFSDTPILGDRYLFCTDGLSSYVEPGIIEDTLRLDSLDDAVDQMVAAASAAGAPDNITLVLVQMVAKDAELDAAPAKLWGAAATMTPPAEPAPAGAIADELIRWGVRPTPAVPLVAATAPAPSLASTSGPTAAPTAEPTSGVTQVAPRVAKRSWMPWAGAGLATLVVLISAAIGTDLWLRSQYFLGPVGGQVAIFQGVPTKIGPLYLSSVAQSSTVNLSDLPVYYADQVRHWAIRPTSLEAARQSLAQLQAKADVCVQARLNPGLTTGGEDCP